MGPPQLNFLFNVTGAGYCGHRVSYHLHLHVDPLHHPAVPGIKGYINKGFYIARVYIYVLHPTFKIKFLKLRKEN